MIEVGDYVRINNNSLTWKVLSFHAQLGAAMLESGQTGRRRLEPTPNLVFHSKGER